MSPASAISWRSGTRESAATSAGNPLMTFCACVVLPPNDVENWTCWSSCVSFQSDWKGEISLPETSYTLLYAVTVTIGDSAGVQFAPPLEPPPHAAARRPDVAITPI